VNEGECYDKRIENNGGVAVDNSADGDVRRVSLLTSLISDPSYAANTLRQDLWRAGHAHAGVFLLFSLIALRYVDEARLSNGFRWFARTAIPTAAIPISAAFFLSVLTLGIGLIRARGDA
jgi:hypothetical protein